MDAKMETIKSVLITNGTQFVIPDFQRGYRWGEEQVEDLLTDLENYYDNNYKDGQFIGDSETNYYCLQSLIVHKSNNSNGSNDSNNSNDSNGSNEEICVIDGQQRLTTMYLLISYMINNSYKRNDSDWCNIKAFKYDAHSETTEYMKNLKEGTLNAPKTRDEKHMYDAYKTIEKVCTSNPSIKAKLIRIIQNDRVKFIYQEYVGDNPIEIFESINVGKIPLTDAELIRAKIILKGDDANANRRARKWDEIEQKLQDDSMWYFLTKNNNDTASRISLLFELLVERAPDKNISKSGHWIYRFLSQFRFNNELYNDFNTEKGDTFESEATVAIFWKKVEDLYEAINKWYRDVELYNYIGQIMYSNSASLCALYVKYIESDRNDFIRYLKEIILNSIRKEDKDKPEYSSIWPKNVPATHFKENEKNNNQQPGQVMIFNNKTIDCTKEIGTTANGTITWTSTRPEIARVSKKGIITANNPGFTTVTGVDEKNNKLIYEKLIEVEPNDTITLEVGTNQSNDFIIDLKKRPQFNQQNGEKLKWVSDNSDIASVDENGIVKVVSIGTVLVRGKTPKNKYIVKIEAKASDEIYKNMFRSLWYSGRSADPNGVGDRDRVKFFLIWSNCELLNKQMLTARANGEERNAMYRFPFHILINTTINVEHVDSYIDKADKNDFSQKDAEKLIEDMYVYLNDDDKKEIDDIKGNVFDKYNAIIEKMVSSNENNEVIPIDNSQSVEDTLYDRRRIANLALLDPGTNKGYGNNPFCVKRGDILRKEMNGVYYYPCTKMLFLKQLDPKTPNLVRWYKQDFMNYLYFLANQFVDCFYDDNGKFLLK